MAQSLETKPMLEYKQEDLLEYYKQSEAASFAAKENEAKEQLMPKWKKFDTGDHPLPLLGIIDLLSMVGLVVYVGLYGNPFWLLLLLPNLISAVLFTSLRDFGTWNRHIPWVIGYCGLAFFFQNAIGRRIFEARLRKAWIHDVVPMGTVPKDQSILKKIRVSSTLPQTIDFENPVVTRKLVTCLGNLVEKKKRVLYSEVDTLSQKVATSISTVGNIIKEMEREEANPKAIEELQDLVESLRAKKTRLTQARAIAEKDVADLQSRLDTFNRRAERQETISQIREAHQVDCKAGIFLSEVETWSAEFHSWFSALNDTFDAVEETLTLGSKILETKQKELPNAKLK